LASAIQIVSGLMVLAGALFCVIAGIGMLRLPDFFSRTHASSIGDTLGAGLVLLGLALHESAKWFDASPEGAEMSVILKLLLLLAVIYGVSPTATHALAKAAFSGGVKVKPPKDKRKPLEESAR